MDVGSRVGWNIRRLRVSLRLSQEQLADEAALEPRHVSSLENGEGNPTLSTLKRLADALHVDVKELFDRPTSPQLPPNLKKGRKPPLKRRPLTRKRLNE